MSDDLISRSYLLKQYDLKDCTKYGSETAEQQRKSYDTMMLYEIAGMIEDAPTAYDVDKVIEQLEERKEYLLKDFVLADKADEVKERTMARINEIDGIIEIVKSGGVADD